jgi:hypothetical protein
MSEKTPKKRSEKRKRNPRITVRFSPEEIKKIEKKANQCSIPPSTYLRKTGLEEKIKTTFDSQVVLELGKLRAEVGRLGGLIKAWLSPHQQDIGTTPESKEYLIDNKPVLKELLRDLNLIILKIEDKVKVI